MPSIHKDKEHTHKSPAASAAALHYDTTNSSWPGAQSSCTKWPAGFLADGSIHKAAFPTDMAVSGCAIARRLVFPNHSDEIVQDLHLFPFYPLAHKTQPKAPVIFVCIQLFCRARTQPEMPIAGYCLCNIVLIIAQDVLLCKRIFTQSTFEPF